MIANDVRACYENLQGHPEEFWPGLVSSALPIKIESFWEKTGSFKKLLSSPNVGPFPSFHKC